MVRQLSSVTCVPVVALFLAGVALCYLTFVGTLTSGALGLQGNIASPVVLPQTATVASQALAATTPSVPPQSLPLPLSQPPIHDVAGHASKPQTAAETAIPQPMKNMESSLPPEIAQQTRSGPPNSREAPVQATPESGLRGAAGLAESTTSSKPSPVAAAPTSTPAASPIQPEVALQSASPSPVPTLLPARSHDPSLVGVGEYEYKDSPNHFEPLPSPSPSSNPSISPQASAPPNPVVMSLIVPYYNQHELILQQFQRWSAYSQFIRYQIEIIIVDDGSRKEPLLDAYKEAKRRGILPDTRLLVLSLDKDVGFNHGGACNTGVKHATGNALVFADADHWFEPDVMERVVFRAAGLPAERRFAAQFATIDSKFLADPMVVQTAFTRLKGHERQEWIDKNMAGSPNTMIIPRQFFIRVGGYDEDLMGLYGYNDIALQLCISNKHRTPVRKFSYQFGKGLWAAYDAGEASSGFDRNTTAAYNLWKQSTSRHRWCHDGPWARVPYSIVGAVNWAEKSLKGLRRLK